jgi:hypothetical protein
MDRYVLIEWRRPSVVSRGEWVIPQCSCRLNTGKSGIVIDKSLQKDTFYQNQNMKSCRNFINGLREKLALYARTRKTGDTAEALNLDI